MGSPDCRSRKTATKGEFATHRYRARFAPCLEGPAVGLPAEVAERWPALPVVGDGARVHDAAFAGREVLPEPVFPSAARIAELAVAGADVVLTPRYLRRPDAQVPGPVKPVTA